MKQQPINTSRGAGEQGSRQHSPFLPFPSAHLPSAFFLPLLLLILLPLTSLADTVIATNSFWRFKRGTNEASAPLGTEWRTNTFDDSTWEIAQAPFYFGTNYNPGGGTLLSDMQSNYTCIFLRSTFLLTNEALPYGLSNRPYADDGYIFWINGVEVQRRNMFTDPFLPYTTNANIATFAGTWFNNNAFTNALRQGTNVVAYQVFNYRIWDTDFFANPEVFVSVPDVTPPYVLSAVPAFGAVTNQITTVTVVFSEPVSGVLAGDFFVGGYPATGVTGSGTTYTFTFPPLPAGPLPVTWDINQTITDGAGLRMKEAENTWGYTVVDTLPPSIVQLTPAANSIVGSLAQIELRFSEPVSGVDASDLLVNGQPSSSVFGSGAGPYIFSFPPPSTGTVQFAWSASHNIRDQASPPNPFPGGGWTVTLNPAAFQGDVVINEILTANILTNSPMDLDEDGELQDWIELYNRGANPVRLLGWSLTTDSDNPELWTFPDISMAPGSYLLVYASGKDRKPTNGAKLHTNFKLNPNGEYLALYSADFPRRAVSEFTPEYPEQRNDYSYGLTPNGWRYFQTPTPGAANGTSTITNVIPPLHVNVARGIFDLPFTLVVSCDTPGATIRYTTDGSQPTAASPNIYSGPLVISNTTVIRLAAYQTGMLPSRVSTHSYIFYDSVLRQPNNPAGYPVGPTVWTGYPSDYEMDPEIVTNAMASAKDALKALPVLSIAISIEDMFSQSSNNGIYTHPEPPASQRNLWERPISAEFILTNNDSGFAVDCGLRIQGNASRTPQKTPKHPFRLMFKGEYGEGRLHYRLYPDSPVDEFNTVVLRADFNNSWTHWDSGQRLRGTRIRDAWSKDTFRAMGQAASHNRHFHLFVNGLYWGVYDFSERVDANFAASYYGGDGSEYDAIASKPTEAVDGNMNAYNTMVANVRNKDMRQLTNYTAALRYVDMTNFVDYMLLNFYGANQDWGFDGNWNATARRSTGLFKYHEWDGEQLVVGATDNRVNNTDVPSGLHTNLINSSEYRLFFADRAQKHLFNGGAFTTNQTIPRWLARAQSLDTAIIAESARWGDYRRDVHQYQTAPYFLYDRANYWLPEINRMVTSYFPQRPATLISQLRSAGLFPSVSAPTFSQFGGRIAPGFTLTMSASNTIYFTTNGTDPRVYGTGAISPVASAYTAPIAFAESTTVKARALFGTNWSPIVEATFEVARLLPPVRITELMYNPVGGDAYEYIELQNIGTTTLDIGNWSFGGINFVFPFGYSLLPGQRIVLGNGASTNNFASRYPNVAVAGWFGGALANNNGEAIILYDATGRVVTSVTFSDRSGWVAAADGGGYSLEVIDPDGDPDDPANWQASAIQNGSPGQPNSVAPAATVVINEVMSDNVSAVNHEGTFPDYVELFNPTASAIDLTSWSLTDDSSARKYVFPNGTMLPPGGYLVVWCDTNTLASGLHSGFALGRNGETVSLYDAASLRVDAISYGPGVANFSVGRVANAWTLTTASPGAANTAVPLASSASLSINEWLANSVPGGDDFVELFNTNASAPVALRNIALGVNSEIDQIESLSFIPPRGYLALIADGNAGADHLRFKLPAAGATIVLYDGAGAEVQRVTYSAQAQGVSEGRLPDGSATTQVFPGSASPGTTNYVINYTGPVLNEVLARNSGAVSGPWGNYPDFVELFNPGAGTFNLGGMGLSDDAGKVKFVFAPGTSIAANGYLIVWCDSDRTAETNGTLNSGFALSGSSGGVHLFNTGGQVVDSVEYGFQVQNLPIGRSGGQWRLLASATPGAANAPAAALGAPTNLRINEWMAKPASGSDWFELYNLDPLPVSLSGLFLTDDLSLAGLSNTPIAALSFIGGKDFVKWIADQDPSQGRDHARFDLDKDGDNIRLYAADFSIMDSVSFGAQTEGVSQGRLPDGGPDVRSFTNSPTPEASNYLPLSDVVINEALTHADPPLSDSIEIQNVGAAPVNLGGWFISNSQTPLQKFRIAAGTTIAPGGFVVFTEADFNADGTGSGTNFTLNSAHGDAIYLSQADGAGNLTGYRAQVRFGAAENGVSFGRFPTSVGSDFVAMAQRTFGASNVYPKIGPVVINEIMYHPNSGGTENSDEEFIELYNMSGAPVPLFDSARPTNVWQVRGGVSFDFTSNITLPANGSLLLVDFDPAVNLPAVLNFRAKYGTNGTLVGPISGRLNNAGEAVELYKPDAPQTAPHPDTNFVPMILVDRVDYSGFAFNVPNFPSSDGGGASLQRIAPALYGNEPLNWKAEPPTAGGTNVQGALVMPTIVAPPTNAAVVLNGTVTFSVTANGSVPLDYQWQYAPPSSQAFADLPGANSATLIINDAQLSAAGLYRVIVTNLAGAVTSEQASLTVLAPPLIHQQPAAQMVIAGNAVQFEVVADGTAPLHYQWRVEGVELPGQTSPQLTLNNVQPSQAGNYTVVITNAVNAITSAPALLTVLVLPTITSDPTDVTVFDGDPAVFQVSATGTAPLSYQWRKDNVNIPGANGPSYTIGAAHSSDEGTYSVFVTNIAGNATSLGAVLRVNLAPFLGQPRLRGDGTFEFRLNGATNRNYTIEFTTGFAGWTDLTNILLTSPQTLVVDPGASNAPARFYRVRTP